MVRLAKPPVCMTPCPASSRRASLIFSAGTEMAPVPFSIRYLMPAADSDCVIAAASSSARFEYSKP